MADAKASGISCIDKNVDAVERAFDNLNEASDFIVLRLCNAEGSLAEKAFRAENKRRQTEYLDEICGELPADVEDEPFNAFSEINFDEASEEAALSKIKSCRHKNVFGGSLWDDDNPELLDPPSYMFHSYASQRLLNLRIARLEGGSTGDN